MKNGMEYRHILIVEDDPTQFNLIEEELLRRFKEIEISDIQTEAEFYDRLDEIIASPPDLIIMDMMLRWTDPAPPELMAKPPDQVEEEGYFRAGIRCAHKLLSTKKANEIPVLLFTVLGQEDIEDDLREFENESSLRTSYLPKTSRVTDLIKEIIAIAPVLKDNLIE